MAGETNKICPECNGEKTVAGRCVCDMEWRGSQKDESWEDCKCTEKETCPVCRGTGSVPVQGTLLPDD